MDSAATNDKIKQFRAAKTKGRQFKKAAMGGYQCREVDEYIALLNDQLEQTKKAFEEKTEETAGEYGILQIERDKLARANERSEHTLEQLRAQLEEEKGHVDDLSEENARLQALIKALQEELDEKNKQDTKALLDENEKLARANEHLLAQIDALGVQTTELKRAVKDLKADREIREDAINALNTQLKNQAAQTNMHLYQYKLYLDSSIKNAAQSMRELSKVMDSVKENAEQLYKGARMQAESE